ncbi:hypothetical protein [Streptomyces sp. NPDC026589]|uniref:hypothetical protein n=1 Tax=Streptomyces sp. NPDC026589 TaxID=3155609 RepID=UPI0033D88A18
MPFNLLLLKDFDESAPWRRISSVHGMAHYSGGYASATTGGQVADESRLELVGLQRADVDPPVRLSSAR